MPASTKTASKLQKANAKLPAKPSVNIVRNGNKSNVVGFVSDRPPQTIGRPQAFPDSKILEAFEVVSYEGLDMKSACKRVGINYYTAMGRIYASPALLKLDTIARQHYVRIQARRMNEIADTEPDVQVARLKCDNIKWEAARVIPKEFGDRIVHAGDKDAPLQHDIRMLDPVKLANMSAIEKRRLLESLDE